MPSNNKTLTVELNQWQENEYPKREDFNLDNIKLDTKMGDHESRINDLETTTTDNSILSAVKRVDGATSGLDSDLLDGNEGSYYLDTDNHVDGSTNKVFTSAEKVKLASIEDGANAGLSPAETFEEIKLMDGSGSGLDSDLLDGKESSYFLDVDKHVDGYTNKVFTSTEKVKLASIEEGATGDQSASELLTLLKTVDGSGTGLDADTVDGVQASSFLRSDATDMKTGGNLTLYDNISLYLGTGNDYRMWHNGTNTYFRNNTHGAATYFQGEDAGGTALTMMHYDPDNYVGLYYQGNQKINTASYGAYVTGDVKTSTALNTTSQYLAGAINELAGRSEGLLGTSVQVMPISFSTTAAAGSVHPIFNITGEKVILGGQFYMRGSSDQGGVTFNLVADNQTVFNYSLNDTDFVGGWNGATYSALDNYIGYYKSQAYNTSNTSVVSEGAVRANMYKFPQMGLTTNLSLTATTGSHTANQQSGSSTATVQPFTIQCYGIIYYCV